MDKFYEALKWIDERVVEKKDKIIKEININDKIVLEEENNEIYDDNF